MNPKNPARTLFGFSLCLHWDRLRSSSGSVDPPRVTSACFLWPLTGWVVSFYPRLCGLDFAQPHGKMCAAWRKKRRRISSRCYWLVECQASPDWPVTCDDSQRGSRSVSVLDCKCPIRPRRSQIKPTPAVRGRAGFLLACCHTPFRPQTHSRLAMVEQSRKDVLEAQTEQQR